SHLFFFFNDPATTEIYTLSLHDALPILDAEEHLDGLVLRAEHGDEEEAPLVAVEVGVGDRVLLLEGGVEVLAVGVAVEQLVSKRSEEHTSELQSQSNLVCRLLLEKKKKN